MRKIELKVSTKVDGKYSEVGQVAVVVPLLEDFIAECVAAKVTTEADEDGMPVFDNEKANFVQSAVFAYVKAAARNKLIPKTADLKPGLKIAETWDELTAEGGRGGGAAALALIRELREAFADHVKTLGKSEAAQKVLNTYFSNKGALEMANADSKGKMKAYIEAFSETLDEEQLEKFARPLEAVLELCEKEVSDF
jgi:hypothetical protein